MKKLMIASLLTLTLGIASNASANYTVTRPIDSFLGNWLDHSYTIQDNWSTCWESFGGGCDCAGQSACYWYEHGSGGSCTDAFFHQWTYGSNGVCHQATNNNAYYMPGNDQGTVSMSTRGMSISIGMFGKWGSPDNC
jgi:hypothetical protein